MWNRIRQVISRLRGLSRKEIQNHLTRINHFVANFRTKVTLYQANPTNLANAELTRMLQEGAQSYLIVSQSSRITSAQQLQLNLQREAITPYIEIFLRVSGQSGQTLDQVLGGERPYLEKQLRDLGANDKQIEEYCCPITSTVIVTPVKIRETNGQWRYFEKAALEHAIHQDGRINPLNKQLLAEDEPLPAPEFNEKLDNFIKRLLEHGPIPYVDEIPLEPAQENDGIHPLIAALNLQIKLLADKSVRNNHQAFLESISQLCDDLNADITQQTKKHKYNIRVSAAGGIAREAASMLRILNNDQATQSQKMDAVNMFERKSKQTSGLGVGAASVGGLLLFKPKVLQKEAGMVANQARKMLSY
jgi:hypothetical protein